MRYMYDTFRLLAASLPTYDVVLWLLGAAQMAVRHYIINSSFINTSNIKYIVIEIFRILTFFLLCLSMTSVAKCQLLYNSEKFLGPPSFSPPLLVHPLSISSFTLPPFLVFRLLVLHSLLFIHL